MSDQTRESGCLCGAVQLEITGEPSVMAFCHCQTCRGWLGAPVHAASLWPTPNVRVVKGEDCPSIWSICSSSAGAPTSFAAA